MRFMEYEFKDYICQAIKELGFKDFTEVQKEVLNKIKIKKNMLVRSKTGSGKTHAFLIPIFNDLDEDKEEIQAVIVSPTTELATQIYKMAAHIASFSPNTINIKLLTGGTDRNREIGKLKNKQPQIVIGTPGKIHDLAVNENVLKIYKAKYFIIDEADMALEKGYNESLDDIAAILVNSKMMFFSATISEALLPFVKKYLDQPEYINIEDNKTLAINHIWIYLKHRSKEDALKSLLGIINPYLAIVFVNKKEDAGSVAGIIKKEGYDVGVIHGDISPRERKRIFQNANDLKYHFLVATDLAARGIDIPGISHIINYDLPLDYEFYVHRTGRTGRMHTTGVAYSFYENLNDTYLDNLNRKGIIPTYMEIKDKQLVEHRGRNLRANRVKPLTDLEKKAHKIVKKPDRVSPGYKKKRQAKIDKIVKKQKRKNY